jgi:hypothetical protein
MWSLHFVCQSCSMVSLLVRHCAMVYCFVIWPFPLNCTFQISENLQGGYIAYKNDFNIRDEVGR